MSRAGRVVEAVVVGLVGMTLGGLVGSTLGLTVPAAIVGGLNGAIGGARRIYRWRSPSGVVAFVLDSTWALVTSMSALVAHLVAAVQRDSTNYRTALSERANRHVYARGFRMRRGFLLTVGNVVNGAGAGPRIARIVADHEHVHVWQARAFGPFFPLLYGGWMVAGAVIGAVGWLVRPKRQPFAAAVDAWAYYRNPFEWWAYSREGRWPPPRVDASTVWSKPMTAARPSTR
ncbi:hypothetical protein [Desertimonas flava]|uniref:hypothetical protein n=1 Tax=Desertimonas flava TaxID=2064846 RepID=UPI0013C45009|nr:hypothetical protein [Desertimonas flava]